MENYNDRYSHGKKEWKIKIDNLIYQKIMHWVDKAVGEVSGLGKLEIDKATGTIEIKSAILLKQENTGSTTDLDATAVAKAMYEMRDEPGSLNFWWHSHVNMGVFWSGTDITTIKEIGEQGFCVATVFNKKREMKSCLYKKINDDFMTELFIDDIPTHVIDYIPANLITEWDQDFDAKCTVKSYPTYGAQDGSWANWYRKNKKDHYDSEYGQDWYEGFYTESDKKPDDTIVHDDIKLYAVIPELTVLKDLLEKETEYGKAKMYLSRICGKINKLKLTDPSKSYNAKEPYLLAFKLKFPSQPQSKAV